MYMKKLFCLIGLKQVLSNVTLVQSCKTTGLCNYAVLEKFTHAY